MNYIRIAPDQEITLKAKKGVTPTQAIYEAIEFSIIHKTKQCDLLFGDFTFGIEPTSDIKQLVRDYRYWQQMQLQADERECIGKDEESE